MDSLLVVAPSTLAMPTLEPIPQSVAPTPSLRESPPREAAPSNSQSVPSALDPPTPGEFASSSRRSSISSYLPIPGSYFPAPGTSSRKYYAPSSGTSTPSERPRPSPISIPAGSAEEPLFSSYPDTGTFSKHDAKGKGRAFNLPLASAFSLGRPRRKRRGEEAEESSADEWKTPISGPSSSRYPQPYSQPHSNPQPQSRRHSRDMTPTDSSRTGRKRAVTVSHAPVEPGRHHRKSASTSDTADETRLHTVPAPTKALRSFRKRRASLGSVPAPVDREFEPPGTGPLWPSMVEQVAQRFEPPSSSFPFAYQQPASSDYTLQSVSTVATVRPLTASPGPEGQLTTSPSIAPRRSSLEPTLQTTLGLHDVAALESGATVEIVIPDNLVMPHDPPPRGSSLDLEHPIVLEVKSSCDPELPPSHLVLDGQSILSASLTNTDTSASQSAAAFSPSSSREHPLSSATTSLSRSAKSGKEGDDENKDPTTLSATQLQRSLEWEAKLDRHRRQIEKRRMILVELVETEVAYAEDLKTLVHVYLPQLAALPSVTERQAKAIARNTDELLIFHSAFASKMIDVLKEQGLGYHYAPADQPALADKVEKAAKKLACLFVDDIAHFSMYKDFCADSIIASTLVRHISERVEYENFEKRCTIISNAQPFCTLKDLLNDISSPGVVPHRSRLHFKDYLITPIQRICRYPLLLGQLLDAASPSSPDEEHGSFEGEDYDVGVDIERALGAMRGVAEEADEARRLKDAEVKSATVLDRLEHHPNLTPTFIRSLGTCRLIGSLDVLHHHPTLAPLVPPVKVKYLAAFLYRGYLILAKVKKNKTYEARHFLPLEVFELINITEGFLPHSIRLTLRDHNFDLAVSCEAEKDVWSAAICEARDESVVPPFELPASVSPFPVRTRRMSTAVLSEFDSTAPQPQPAKRHTLAGPPSEVDETPNLADFAVPIASSKPSTPLISPIKATFGFTPERRTAGQPGTILLRRASNNQRMLVERGLSDLFSDVCATARSKAQMQHSLFLPDGSTSELNRRLSMKDSTMLRRRKSFLDSRHGSIDIAITGDVKGSVIELRPSRSSGGGKYRTLPAQRKRSGSVGSTRGVNDSGDESATAMGNQSDFGTLPRPYTRTNSASSFSPMMTPRRSLSSLRNFGFGEQPPMPITHDQDGHRDIANAPAHSQSKLHKNEKRKSKSQVPLNFAPRPYSGGLRAKSVPASPALSPKYERFGGEDEEPFAEFGTDKVPMPPPLVHKSASDQSPSLQRRSISRDRMVDSRAGVMEYFIPPPHGAPLESIGNNVPLPASQSVGNNAINPDKPLVSTWGTLRRSMSFLPMKSRGSFTSSTSMEEAFGGTHIGGASMSASNSGSGSGSGSTSVSASAFAEGDGLTSHSRVSFTTEDDVGDGPIEMRSARGKDKERSSGEGPDSQPGTPKRKKSMRLFGLRGFTPI
ncbi:hypothetical protein I316_03443 [Kwoniella heveanensis BCC8398]|uniref:DH domain-containing protein n=1 Tax=Kwoniella heveanensis BCC8398 TaxID=1296120 RepID=A0A1B9GV33_9TREE|nr:hypothetical protein I316_03443 [Kwoniella heveanensis BCC8398]